jgi:MFS family permease
MISDEFRRGWKVLLASSIGVGCGINLNQYVGSLFVKELQGEFGWSRGQISQAQGALFLGLILAPFLGRMIDSWGVRIIALTSAVFLAMIYLMLSQIGPDIFWYYALFAGQIILGSATGPIAFTRAVNTWFVKSRGLALGITLMGVSVGGIVAPPILAAIMANYGWRTAYIAMAGLLLVLAVPAIYFGLYERSTYLKRHQMMDESAEAASQAMIGFSLSQALRQYRFYVLAGCIFTMTIGLVGVISQLVPILTDKGLPPSTAALFISVLAGSVMLGRVVMGLLFDRFWAPIPAAIALALPAVGVLLLMGTSTDFAPLIAGVALIGFAQGAEVDVAAYFIARYFGMRAYGAVYAFVGMGFGSGTAVGAIMAGRLFDMNGNYETLLLLAAALFVVSGLIILLMGRYPNFADMKAAPSTP